MKTIDIGNSTQVSGGGLMEELGRLTGQFCKDRDTSTVTYDALGNVTSW